MTTAFHEDGGPIAVDDLRALPSNHHAESREMYRQRRLPFVDSEISDTQAFDHTRRRATLVAVSPPQ
jgi:hypothetical protein